MLVLVLLASLCTGLGQRGGKPTCQGYIYIYILCSFLGETQLAVLFPAAPGEGQGIVVEDHHCADARSTAQGQVEGGLVPAEANLLLVQAS